MMTWKEPLAVRQQYIKLEPALQPKRVLLAPCVILVHSLLVAAFTFYFDPKLRNEPERAIDMAVSFAFILSICILAGWVIPIITHRFEATYRLDDKGITIQRAGISMSVADWRYVRSVEIVSHPTIENVSLLKISSGTFLNKRVVQVPFETGQISAADLDEIRKSLGRKKR